MLDKTSDAPLYFNLQPELDTISIMFVLANILPLSTMVVLAGSEVLPGEISTNFLSSTTAPVLEQLHHNF